MAVLRYAYSWDQEEFTCVVQLKAIAEDIPPSWEHFEDEIEVTLLRVYHGTVTLAWKDSKAVHLSTAHYPNEVATVQRQQKDRRTGQYAEVDVESHKIVVDYNANMGAVDTKYQMTTVRNGRKQLRWYMRLIIKWLEIAAYNSYIVKGHFKAHAPDNPRRNILVPRAYNPSGLWQEWRALGATILK